MKGRDAMYDLVFYRGQQEGSYRSALHVLPILFDHYRPGSIVDFGCGVGTWLRAAKELGVNYVTGLDGSYVDRDLLQIPSEQFIEADLSKPVKLAKKYDLAISLEVAEHLPREVARSFVHSITSVADVVLFSAASRYQGGTNHINNDWPEYWAILFEGFDFLPVDFIRHRIGMEEVEPWYKRNIILYMRRQKLHQYPELKQYSHRKVLSDSSFLGMCMNIANNTGSMEQALKEVEYLHLIRRNHLKRAGTIPQYLNRPKLRVSLLGYYFFTQLFMALPSKKGIESEGFRNFYRLLFKRR